MTLKRIKTYIKGLDRFLEGGIPENYNILLCGSPGTFKSTFAYQFCYYGVLNGEPAMYITLEQSIDNLRTSMSSFGMSDLPDNFICMDMSVLRKIASQRWTLESPSYRIDWFPTIHRAIETIKEEIGIKRLAFDSLNALYELVSVDKKNVRKNLFDFLMFLNDMGLTTILISELPIKYESYGKFGVEDFLTDGIILLENIRTGFNIRRYLHIVKMRATNHETRFLPLTTDEHGLVVLEPGSDEHAGE